MPPRGAHAGGRASAPALALACAASAIALGYLLARRGPEVGLVLLVLPAAYYAATHRLGPMIAAVVLFLVVPYWYTVGVQQLAVIRVASLLALGGCLYARKSRLHWVDVSVLGVVLVTVFGWLLQNDQPQVVRAVESETIPFALYVGARLISPSDVPRVMSWVFYAGAAGALTVIYEELVGHVVFANAASYFWNATAVDVFRPAGIFATPPGAATVLMMTTLCGLPLWRSSPKNRRWIVGACAALSVAACVMTFTRANLIALGFGALAYLVLTRSRLLSPARVVAAVVLIPTLVLLVLPRVQGSTTFQSGIVRGGTFEARVGYWREALPIATSSPHNLIFGIGAERTVIASQGGSMPAALAEAPQLYTLGTHNQYLLALLEEGLIGLAALVAWLGLVIGVSGRRAWRRSEPVDAALCVAALAFAIDLLADNALLHPPSLAIIALISGLVVARSSGPAGAATASGSLRR